MNQNKKQPRNDGADKLGMIKSEKTLVTSKILAQSTEKLNNSKILDSGRTGDKVKKVDLSDNRKAKKLPITYARGKLMIHSMPYVLNASIIPRRTVMCPSAPLSASLAPNYFYRRSKSTSFKSSRFTVRLGIDSRSTV